MNQQEPSFNLSPLSHPKIQYEFRHTFQPSHSIRSLHADQQQFLNAQLLELLQTAASDNNINKVQKIYQIENPQLSANIQTDQEKQLRRLLNYNFKANCHKSQGVMDYTHFRKMLGLLGRQDSFISRIFYLIDADNDGFIHSQEYVNYMMKMMFGTQQQKAYYSWCILRRSKAINSKQQNDLSLQLDDFMQVFQQISMVWNALTDESLPLNKKYVEELFSIFDLDQDQIITFNDYKIFYHEHPYLFGWFEYLNGIEIDEKQLDQQVKSLRMQLSSGKKKGIDITIEQINDQITHRKNVLENNMKNMIKMLQSIKQLSSKQVTKLNSFNHSNQSIFQNNVSTHNLTTVNTTTINSSYMLNHSLDTNASHKSIQKRYKYNLPALNQKHIKGIEKINQGQLSRLENRKKQIVIDGKIEIHNDLMRQFKHILEHSNKMITNCEQFKTIKQLKSKYSPIKLKEKKVKYNVVHNKTFLKKEISQEQHTEKKKQKNSLIYFGHPNWNLVLNLMVGLRKSIKALYELNFQFELQDKHFVQIHEFLLGNKVTNGQHFSQYYKFIENAPLAFERLRRSFGVSNLQYQRSVGPQILMNHLLMGNLTTINEKCSTGKSGSFFYLTLDNKVFLKTIPKRQYDSFLSILKGYYKHMVKNENSLIVRIYGLYKLKVYQNKQKISTIYFISMENIFSQIRNATQNNFKIRQIYDLKGSLYGRTGTQGGQLKDNDWVDKKKRLHLDPTVQAIFREQIKNDCKLFKHESIIDYSLLVAVVQIRSETQQKSKNSKSQFRIQLQENIFKKFYGGVASKQYGVFYVMSIIDTLTKFQTSKNLEYLFKSTFLSKDVSCVPPRQYSQRFKNFILDYVLQSHQQHTFLKKNQVLFLDGNDDD